MSRQARRCACAVVRCRCLRASWAGGRIAWQCGSAENCAGNRRHEAMSWPEWMLQLAVVALLVAAMPFALRLERELRAVRRDRGALEGSAAGLNEATRMAEAASLRLRAAAETSGRQIAEKLATAEPLRDDLRYLAERAE